MPDNDSDDNTQTYIPLASGTMVSHYRIIEKIGAGGMGEVYLAEDTKLRRKVALKFLPPHLCQDPECRARFTREAEAAAQLDHPNIVAVHEVSEFQGRPFFSMQHVEGQSLKEVTAGKTLSLERIIEIGMQVCDGLQAAHEKGITHRDIKPSNILIDAHGRARIVDFGLASVMGTDHLTKTGSTLGTVGYMSPEQVRGEKVDHRTDLFSVGAVLYELITGHSPFKCDTEAATLHAITDINPEPLARFRREVPPELQTIIDKALEKKVTTRYQHADELGADLKRVREPTSPPSHSQGIAAPATPGRRWLAAAAVVGAAVVLVAAVWFLRGRGDHAPSPVAKPRQITFDGDIQMVDISPDGSKLAFVRGDPGDHRLYAYSLAGGEPLLIFQGGYIGDISWSPDANSVLAAGFLKGGSVGGPCLIPFMGGTPRFFPANLCNPCRVSWDPSGSAFYYHESCDNPQRFLRFDLRTGDRTPCQITMPVKWVLGIKCSPKGDRLLFEILSDSGSALWTCRPDGSDSRKMLDLMGLLDRSHTCCSPDGKAVYFLQVLGEFADLLKQAIDSHTGEAVGAPRVLLSGLETDGPISVTSRATKLAYVRTTRSSTQSLWLRNQVNGKPEYAREVIGTSTVNAGYPHFSPDGSSVAYVTIRNNQGCLHLFSLPDRTTRSLDIAGRDVANCAWSPDGKTLAILYRDKSVMRLCLADANSGTLLQSPQDWINLIFSEHISWAPNEKILAQTVSNRNFYRLDSKSGTVETLIPDDSVGWAFNPVPSARQEVAVHWVVRGGYQYGFATGIWRISPDGARPVLLAQVDGKTAAANPTPLCWSSDEKYLYWKGNRNHNDLIFRTSRDGAVTDTILDFGQDVAVAAMTPDASYIFTISSERKGDVWLIENFDPDVK